MLIYKITNKIDGKIYIGQTIRKIKERWENHKTVSKYLRRDTYLYRAIRKYGPENFTIEEIDGANSMSELNYKEWLLIHKFNSLAPNGYNLREGGGNSKRSKETIAKVISSRYKNVGGSGVVGVVCLETKCVYDSLKEASVSTGICKSNISSVLRGISDKAEGYAFRYIDQKLNNKYELKRKKRHLKVKSIAKELGHVIKCVNNGNIYNSIQEAARDLELSAGNIHQILKNKRKQTKGYMFIYKE
jgi:group I intron endonuclease